MFHQVNDNKHTWKDTKCSITFENFKKFVKVQQEKEILFLSIENLYNLNFDRSKKFVCLTFDDAYSEVFEDIYPYFIENNIPFSVFVTTDFIGEKGYLTLEQLKVLSMEKLCTIGAHSITHPLLRRLDNITSEKEIKKSKERLEYLLNIKVDFFAYPYGSVYAVSRRDINNVKKSGYKAAFSTISADVSIDRISNQKYFIPRININDNWENYIEKS